jgi:intracellular sulfur oxidation DsrE/DsrF family protein
MKKLMMAAVLALAPAIAPLAAWAEGAMHKVAIHVDQNDPQVMNMALNNAKNVDAYYKSKGDTVEIEMVAYGPGLMMYVAGKSPVADRISAMGLEMPNLHFAACGNTLNAMKAKSGADVPLMSEAVVVPSGVVRLIELQEAGYAYVRP